MQSPSRCNKSTGRYGPANNTVLCTVYRAENGNFGNFEAAENNGTAFAPQQGFYQNVAVGMENPKMQSPFWCNERSRRNGPGNTPASCTGYRADNRNLGNFEAVENNGTALHQAMFISKGSRGYGEPKNAIAFSVQETHWALRTGKFTGSMYSV